MQICFRVFVFFMILYSYSFSASVSGKELSKLANSNFKVKHFFFYSSDIEKAFLFTKESNVFRLYYFRPDGSWEPVSNAPAFQDMPAAPNQFADISFDDTTNTVTFGEFTGDIQAPAKDVVLKEKTKKVADKNTTAVLSTNYGDITLVLYNDIAPKTVENFVYLSQNNKYDGLTFHRIIDKFMIQGGDPKGDGTGGMSKWGKQFDDEIDANTTFSEPYLLAMANSGPNTNGSQFFITLANTPWLNGKHTIFGKVIYGMDVVKQIAKLQVDKTNKPLKDVKILTIRVTE